MTTVFNGGIPTGPNLIHRLNRLESFPSSKASSVVQVGSRKQVKRSYAFETFKSTIETVHDQGQGGNSPSQRSLPPPRGSAESTLHQAVMYLSIVARIFSMKAAASFCGKESASTYSDWSMRGTGKIRRGITYYFPNLVAVYGARNVLV